MKLSPEQALAKLERMTDQEAARCLAGLALRGDEELVVQILSLRAQRTVTEMLERDEAMARLWAKVRHP